MSTAVTFGLSIHFSIMMGPTEWITTIVFAQFDATVLISTSPSRQAVRLFRSPTLPSTLARPSPEEDLIKTRQASLVLDFVVMEG